MASIKSKKGNPFEYDTTYSLQQGKYKAVRLDDNSSGVDIVIKERGGVNTVIECKNRQKLSWNALYNIWHKTSKTVGHKNCYVVFHSNRQPVLVFYKYLGKDFVIAEFKTVFKCEWKKRPKGYKKW